MGKKIEELRSKIDDIDESIVSLLEERVGIVRDIGKIKADDGVGMYDPMREQEILSRLAGKSALDQGFIMKVYREIIGYCRGDERKIKRKDSKAKPKKKLEGGSVGVLGPAGTFTEQAAKKIFKGAKLTYCEGVDEIFRKVEAGEVGHGVVAIENSLEGSVGKTMEALIEYDVYIVGELTLDINLCLMTHEETERIDVILSHPHALAQCSGYLRENYPEARQVSSKSTAAAMKELVGYENAAAIGYAQAAETYGLKIVGENIQDDFSQTRFIVISKGKISGGKTSIIFAVKDEPGALYAILAKFADKNINLTKIESRPSKRKLGEYLFFMDFENKGLGGREVNTVIESVKSNTTFIKILGSY
ncbi:MAG: prephenate dehydratase [Candidatus Altiarchaeota archaeon]